MFVMVVLAAMLAPVTVEPTTSVAACAGVRVSVVAPKEIVEPPKVTFWFDEPAKVTVCAPAAPVVAWLSVTTPVVALTARTVVFGAILTPPVTEVPAESVAASAGKRVIVVEPPPKVEE